MSCFEKAPMADWPFNPHDAPPEVEMLNMEDLSGLEVDSALVDVGGEKLFPHFAALYLVLKDGNFLQIRPPWPMALANPRHQGAVNALDASVLVKVEITYLGNPFWQTVDVLARTAWTARTSAGEFRMDAPSVFHMRHSSKYLPDKLIPLSEFEQRLRDS